MFFKKNTMTTAGDRIIGGQKWRQRDQLIGHLRYFGDSDQSDGNGDEELARFKV